MRHNAAAVAWMFVSLVSAGAQGRPVRTDSLPGRIVARATAGPDTSQAFAIYFPSAYSTRGAWPALFVMDPRGRAMQGIDLFAGAAERYGFVVLSSYNTLSDGDLAPNVGAINAMLSEAQSSLSVDLSRLYIAGLSGTARVGWSFALEAPKNFAGVFAASAAPALDDSGSKALLRSPGFAFALTAGSADFNWNEVHDEEDLLRRERVPARVDYFDGQHAWPPALLIDRALAWFKLRGMLGGRWAPDTAWISAQIRAELHAAGELERTGRMMAAADAFAQLAIAVQGRPEAGDAGQRAATLGKRADVSAARKKLARLSADEHSNGATLSAVMVEIERSDGSSDPGKFVHELRIPELKRLAAQGDSLERPFAARVLASAATSLGFYEPRRYLEAGQPARAVIALQVVAAIGPWNAQHCSYLERARALMPEGQRGWVPACAR